MKWSLENTYSKLPKSLFTLAGPTPVKKPSLILFNSTLSKEMGLEEFEPERDLPILSGNTLVTDSTPLAQAYSGHQFGHYTQLGDGRAHLLGEVVSPKGQRYDLQLKGSGPTPYSRRGDGRASLGPMLREYITSEAMHALGISTTRSLAVVSTGEPVFRETTLPGAILTRMAKSHIRVGTFEYASSLDDLSTLKALTEYSIDRHYPDSKDPLEFLSNVCKKQAKLVSQWMGVGFIHGVMNTDNMSICGESIDYGPCAFLDEYDSLKVFSFIDRNGRYAFGRQPAIALWNLSRFAETLLPLIDDNPEHAAKKAEEVLSHFSEDFKQEWLIVMSKKLGLSDINSKESLESIQKILDLMERHKADYTNTFRALAEQKQLEDSLFTSEEFKRWKQGWSKRLEPNQSFQTMRSSNPSIIPRNHLVEEALEESLEGSYEKLDRLLEALEKPFDDNKNFDDFKQLPSEAQKVKNTFCGT